MITLRRLIYGEILQAVALATIGFLSLFLFFDLIEEIQSVSRHVSTGYSIGYALVYVLLLIPNHLYELLPITVLIGSIFVMARLAQSSEYTILRTSGLGPWRALKMLTLLGLVFVALTFALGDYLAPLTDRTAQLLKARYTGKITVGQTGAWLKEKQDYSQYAVNVGELTSTGQLKSIKIFEFDNRGQLMSLTTAVSAILNDDISWELHQVDRVEFVLSEFSSLKINQLKNETLRWPNQITSEMISTALLKPERMSTIDLYVYINHLENNSQSSQRYEIEFWKKVFYPLSCMVMIVLALPFAYLHFRSSGIAGYVFGGVMAGISFFLLNNVFGYMGNMQQWWPWLTAAAPSLIYSTISLSAFGWLVIKR